MPMVRAMRVLNAIEAGTLDGAGLETLLADSGRLAEFNVLLGMRGQARRMAASQTTMAAIAASVSAVNKLCASDAMDIMINSGVAMTELSTSADAVEAIINSGILSKIMASAEVMKIFWESDIAADKLLTSAAARLLIYNSDVALEALQATPGQVQRQIGIAGRVISVNTANSSNVFVPNGNKLILLRRYYSVSDYDAIDWARNDTSGGTGHGPFGGGRNLDTGTNALGCVSGSYTSSGAAPLANNDTANFVAAANGLQRRTWQYGATLYLYYISV